MTAMVPAEPDAVRVCGYFAAVRLEKCIGRFSTVRNSKNCTEYFQIPDSPPDYRTLSLDKVRFFLFCEKIWCISARVYFLDDNPDDNHAFLEITVV